MIFQASDFGSAMAGTLTRSQTTTGALMSTMSQPAPHAHAPAQPQYNPVGLEVPFLVNNKEKWISGIVEETTCGDVVKVKKKLSLCFNRPANIFNIHQYDIGAE